MRPKLIAARKAKRLTQEALGALVGVHRTAIVKYESGDSDIPGKVLEKLSTVLGIKMHDLYQNVPDTLTANGLLHQTIS